MNAAKRGDVASFAADETVAQVTRNIGQLDAAALYAASGQLERDPKADPSFVKAQQKLAQACAATRQCSAKALQAGQKGTPTQLKDAMHTVADTSDAVVECAKVAAALIDNLDTQQALLQAAKVVMLSLTQMITASRDAQQSPSDRGVAQAAGAAMLIGCCVWRPPRRRCRRRRLPCGSRSAKATAALVRCMSAMATCSSGAGRATTRLCRQRRPAKQRS